VDPSRIQIYLASAFALATVAAAQADPVAPAQSRPPQIQLANPAPVDPCRATSLGNTRSDAPWRARISRHVAIFVVRHVRKACSIIAENSGENAQLERFALQLTPILNDLRGKILGPIYRSHPDLENADLTALSVQQTGSSASHTKDNVPQATRNDIGRTTAVRLDRDLSKFLQELFKIGAESIDQAADKAAAEKTQQVFADAGAELSFASAVAYAAYPDLWIKKLAHTPEQSRTPDSDANFRKGAPPRGAVKLSKAALAIIRSFMRQLRSNVPQSDHVASIGWARDQRSKGPGDDAWIDQGSGWVLGTYVRTQLPPDVIDHVDGIEIVFSADDPSVLVGKTIDVRGRKFFIRD
jgi:hypothetical protein